MEDLSVLLDLFGIDFNSLIAGIIFGIIGWWIYRQGRKRKATELVIIGVLLMIYPYFFESATANWGIGIALCAAAKYLWVPPASPPTTPPPAT